MSLIARAPMTGSQLVALLRRYPLAGSGKSPGAVYPALYRLEADGLVCARSRRTGRGPALLPAHDARPRGDARLCPQEFGLTWHGIARLRGWATARVTRTEVLERPQHLLLRFAMCSGLAGPTAARRLALQCRRVCTVLATELVEEIDRFRGTVSPSTRLALECTLALLEARVAWSRRAEVELAREAVRAPEEDDPPAVRRARAALARLPARIRDQVRWPRGDGPPPTPPPRPPPGPRPRIPDWEELQQRRRSVGRNPHPPWGEPP